MARRGAPARDGAQALTELLSRLPPGPMTDAIRAEVGRLRRLAIRERSRPETERDRLLQAIADADADYLSARAEGSHQAADRSRRHKVDLEARLAELDVPPGPTRARSRTADPAAGRIEWLVTHLLEIETDLDYLRQTEQWSLISPLDARACALRDELDDARGAAGLVMALERSPGAVAEEVLRRRARLEQLAEAERLARAEGT